MLAAGTRLGPYEILSSLGAGGMGEVYRARDTRLNRDVALKVVPDIFANDVDRVARFSREAQTLATLNHPNIAQVYGLEQTEQTSALVMELVEGDDLAARIQRGPLPLDEAIAVASQIAEALETAHEHGIVHRDLKPANIKVRGDGTVKVLDFGLAKALDPPAGAPVLVNSPTITSPAMTHAGVILGTAAYMSPEQARGRPVDRRADIWALGCVIFEMLTGRQAFNGPTVTDIIASVMRSEPDFSALPAETPPSLRRLLLRALQKDAGLRLRDAGDARLDLEQARAELHAPAAVSPSPAPRSRARTALFAILLLATLAVGASAGLWWQGSRPTPPHWIATRVGGPGIAFLPRVSPDGRMLAFLTIVNGQSQLAVMSADSGDWSLLTSNKTSGPIVGLAWSTDGARIYFDRSRPAGREIYGISPLGGDARLVLEQAFVPEPLADGSLLFLRADSNGRHQLHRFWPDSGRIQPFTVAVHSSFAGSLRAFPDGKEAVVFGRRLDRQTPGEYEYLAIDVASGAVRSLGAGQGGDFFGSEATVPVSVTRDGASVLTTVRESNASTVIAIPRDGSGGRSILFSTTGLIASIDQTSDGRIYVDQLDRSMDHLRFPTTGGVPDRLVAGLPSVNAAGAAALSADRVVYATVIAGRYRLTIARAGEEPVPFVETQEQARGPLARLSDKEFAFVGGTIETPVVAVASSDTGRVLRRLEGTRGRQVTRLAASQDGRTIYFSALGRVWSIPASDGEPEFVTNGTGVASDPRGRFLIIERSGASGTQLIRRDAEGRETPLPLPSDVRATGLSLWPGAVRDDGRIVFVSESDDSWFWSPAVFDPATNGTRRIPIAYAGDAEVNASWDGDLISVLARRIEGAVWRFDRGQ